jgi:hypothetical protein
MRMYWTIKRIPELAGLPPQEQRRLWRDGYSEAHRHWQTWASLAITGVGAAVGLYLGGLVGWKFVGSAIGAALGAVPHAIVSTELARRHLRTRTSSADDDRGER